MTFKAKPRSDRNRFMIQWALAIKGPVDHVELVFSSDSITFTAYYITRNTVTARYRERNYCDFEDDYDINWYRLNTVEFANELHLMQYCEKRSKQNVYMSYSKMIFSATPFEIPGMQKFILPLVEQTDPNHTPKDIFTEDNKKTYHYCASLTAEALQQIKLLPDVDIHKCTANDLIVYLSREKQCVLEPTPKFKPKLGDRSLPGIVRSKEWRTLTLV